MPAPIIPGLPCYVLRDHWEGLVFLEEGATVLLPEPVARALSFQRIVEIRPFERDAVRLLPGNGGGVDNTPQIETVRQSLEAQLAAANADADATRQLVQQILAAPGAPVVQVQLARDPVLSAATAFTGAPVTGSINLGDAIGTAPITMSLQWQVFSGTWGNDGSATTGALASTLSVTRQFTAPGTYRLAATPSNGAGPTNGTTRYSQPVVVTAALVAPSFQVQPFFSTNAPVQGVALTLNRGTASGNPSPTLTSRLVRVSTTGVVTDLGVTGTSYTPVAGDVGSYLRLDVTAAAAGFNDVLASSPLTALVASSAPVVDTDAATYFTAVTAASGTVSTVARAAWEAFVVGTKADSLWTKIQHCHFLLSNWAGLTVPQKGAATVVINGLTAGDFTLEQGMRANGTGYIDTGITIATTTGSIGVYIPPDQNLTGSWNAIGVLGTSGAQLYRIRSNVGALTAGFGGNLEAVGAANTASGFLMVTRRSGTDCQIYRNGASAGTQIGSVTPTTVPLPLYAMARNGGTNGGVSGASQIMAAGLFFGGYIVTDSLTTGEALQLANRVATLMAAIGRNQAQSAIPAAPTARNAIQEPFASSSIWNMPLNSGRTLVPLPLKLPTIGNTTNWTVIGHDREIIFGPQGAQRIVRDNPAGWPARAYPNPAWAPFRFSPVWIPDGVLLPLNGENQMWSAITPSGMVYQEQPIYRETATGELASTDTNNVPAYNIVTGDGVRGSHGGSGLASLGGTLRTGEMRPGPTGSGGVPGLPGTPAFHPLKLTWPYGVNATRVENLQQYNPTTNPRGSWRWPATKSDTSANNAVNSGLMGYGRLADPNFPVGCVAGALLAIDLSASPQSLGLELTVSHLFLWTLQRYGVYLVDDAKTTASAGDLAISEQQGLGQYLWCAQVRGDNETTDTSVDFPAQFLADTGYVFRGRRAFMSSTNVSVQGTQSGNNAWVRDCLRLLGALQLVENHTAATPGGPGTPLWWIKGPATFTP